MTKTMDEAATTLREVVVSVLVERNGPADLCLSAADIARAAELVSQDENMVRLVAFNGMGTNLYEALQDWLTLYERTRQRWLSQTRPGRRVMREHAPAALSRVIKAQRVTRRSKEMAT